MIKNKGQISLEYILLFCAIFAIFSVFVYQITDIYKKNLEILEKKEIQSLKKDLENYIDFLELQTSGKIILKTNYKTEFNLEKNKDLHIISKNYKKTITSENNIILKTKQINKITTIYKTENKIIIE